MVSENQDLGLGLRTVVDRVVLKAATRRALYYSQRMEEAVWTAARCVKKDVESELWCSKEDRMRQVGLQYSAMVEMQGLRPDGRLCHFRARKAGRELKIYPFAHNRPPQAAERTSTARLQSRIVDEPLAKRLELGQEYR